MNWFWNILVVFAFFVLMEGVAWFTHKYIMHGFLWIWHKSHHEPREGALERNDLFGFMFAIPSVWLIVVGAEALDWRFFAGLGIALYGLAYFLVHDVFVHQRIKWLRSTNSPYFHAMRMTHYHHHTFHGKHGSEAFGFLFVSRRFLNRFSKK